MPHRFLPGYNREESYSWNCAHPPALEEKVEVPPWPGSWSFCGLPVNSPLGLAASVLLNSHWVAYYSRLGFDVLTYKTVRSRARRCYPLPNLLPVEFKGADLKEIDARFATISRKETSDAWTISFGVPSADPKEWRIDVRRARKVLAAGQRLVVSVIASPEPDWTTEQIAADYAQCAQWAAEAGAEAIEANLSCPNVATAESSIHLSPDAAKQVALELKRAAGPLPIILKVGAFHHLEEAARFVKAVHPFVTAISTTNTIAARVLDDEGKPVFDGPRGIGGPAIGKECLRQLQLVRESILNCGANTHLIAVGGVSTLKDVEQRLQAGAHHVQIATTATLDASVALQIREEISMREKC